jgi:class 3 adenylate cyclase
MVSPSPRRFPLVSLVLGFVLLGASTGWDLSPWSWALPLPLTPLAFFVFLMAQSFTLGRFLAATDRSTAHLTDTVAENLKEMQAAAEAYSRFVPEQFLRHLKRSSISDVKLGDQAARTMTVMFSDIRDFTSISERLTPEENFRFLNGYLGRIGPVIRQQYGFIDKYIGDAVMALFDGPVDEALGAAMAMQLATVEYNRHLPDPRFGPLTIGIGLHSGPLMLGIIGEEGRMESTVIADAVNLASRIESLTKHYDCRILVSRPTFEAQADPQFYLTRPVDLVRVKGRSESVELLEILDDRFDPRATLKNDLAAHLAEAMMVYRRGDFFGARSLFQTLAYKDPADRLYGIFRLRIEELIRLGAPEGWDGTTVFDVK